VPAVRRRRSGWAAVLSAAVVIAAGFGVALVEAMHLRKGSIWLVVGAAALLVVVIRLIDSRRA
jgi:hypothetical protein